MPTTLSSKMQSSLYHWVWTLKDMRAIGIKFEI